MQFLQINFSRTLYHTDPCNVFFYLQRKDDVLDSFKVTRRNESLFEVREVDTVNVWFFCSDKKLVSFSSKRDRSDAALQLNFSLKEKTKVKVDSHGHHVFIVHLKRCRWYKSGVWFGAHPTGSDTVGAAWVSHGIVHP